MMPGGNGRRVRQCAAWWGRLARWLAFLAVFTAAGRSAAQPMDWADTPPELRPWIPWVLDTLGDELCPRVGELPTCVWPGLLQVDLDGSAGRFRLTVVVDRRTLVNLPGSAQSWPQNVRVDGTAGIVLDRGGVPAIALGQGSHVLEGDFDWYQLPETLTVPSTIALISLRRDGKVVDFPKRDPALLWLRATGISSEEPQRLSLEVFRKLDDGVPFKVTTRLSLRVAGKAREVNLGKVLLPTSSPLLVESALPVRLNEDQTLSAQVYAGNHTIDIEALFADPPGELLRVPHEDPWPTTETWVLVPDPAFRQVELVGARAVDPSRTNLPEEWKRLASYSVSTEAQVSLVTSRRGEPESPPNRLTLERDIWFDLDGKGYTIRDRFAGQMNRDWRLDLSKGSLGRVLLEGEPQLITKNPQTGAPGVELRKGKLDMVAEWRTEGGRSRFPAVGWSEDVQQLSAQVHVPPGWQLINASGVDGLSETWISSWDLFSLFFVLIVSAAIWQLTHLSWGALALLTMVLTHDQPEAPSVLWACLVAVIALLRVIPAGILRKLVVFVGIGFAGALFVTLVTYVSSEVRTALFPQTTAHEGGYALPGTLSAPMPREFDEDSSGSVRYAEEEPEPMMDRKAKRGKGAPSADAPAVQQAVVEQELVQKQQDPSAVVQTGPGVPTWEWQSWHLSWSGPVHRDHEMKLYLLSASGSGLISALRILLTGVMAFLLLRYCMAQAKRPPRGRKRRAASAAMLLLSFAMGGATLLQSPPVAAEVPSDETLTELRNRITRPPLCHPNCISVQRMELDIDGSDLTMLSEVHAAADASYQLPGPFESWAPADVRINGRPAAGMVLGDDGFLHLRLPPGRYRVSVKGPVIGSNVTLTLGEKPRWVQVTAPDWEVDGIDEAGAVEGSLRFHRREQTEEAANDLAAQVNLPSWLLITRTFKFGATWSISTQVERIGTAGSPVVERYTLLPGEQVTRADLVVESGEAVISLAREQKSLAFESVLEPSENLTLVAQGGKRLSERWALQCGPIWRCQATGIAPTSHQRQGHWEPHFTPWPADTLELSLVRPVATEGLSLTVDEAKLDINPGKRLLKATLTANTRSSSRNTLNVSLPQAAEVQEFLLDGSPHALQQLDGKLAITLDPGPHSLKLMWQEPGGMGTLFRAPNVELGSEAVNLRVNMRVPEDRWLLFAPALQWGPAVLFWGYLAFIAILGFALGRLPHSPLSDIQWILLGVGLTQVHAAVAVLIAAWFFAIAYLPSWRPKSPAWHNLTQVGVVWFTVVFLVCLFAAVYGGLLSTPDMQVSGAGSTNRELSWYLDRSATGALPQPWAISTSLWVWRGVMLAWSLWLAFNLLSWLRWGFGMFSRDGMWKKLPKKPRPQPVGPHPAYAQGYANNMTPTPTPATYPGAQWVVAGPANLGVTGDVAPVTPRSAHAPTRRDGTAGVYPAGAGTNGDGADPSPTTLPTGAKATGHATDATRPTQVDEHAPTSESSAEAETPAAAEVANADESPEESPTPPGATATGSDAEAEHVLSSDGQSSAQQAEAKPSPHETPDDEPTPERTLATPPPKPPKAASESTDSDDTEAGDETSSGGESSPERAGEDDEPKS